MTFNREEFENNFRLCTELAVRKNNDYASGIDNVTLTGLHGITVRLLDKIARVYNLTQQGCTPSVHDESLADTFIDIINYGNIGLMLHEDTWNIDDKEGGAK